jgi:hypothetical protein
MKILMEWNLLQDLSWHVCAPTSIQMAQHILSLALPHVNVQDSTRSFILTEVRFQTEYAVTDYYFAPQRPSTVAMATIFNTLEQVDKQDRQVLLFPMTYSLLSVD